MSGTPHMTGSASSEPDETTLSATDLLGEDGKVDTAAIQAITNNGGGAGDKIHAEEVTEIRQRLLRGETAVDIATDMGRHSETIRKHAREEAREYDTEPACPPVEYRDGEWWVVDDD